MKHIRLYKEHSSITFSDTKVIDDNGNPILMYHGGGYCNKNDDMVGTIWFTTCEEDARYYADQSGGCVTMALLNITNPLYAGHVDHLNMEDTPQLIEIRSRRDASMIIEDGIIKYIEPNGASIIAEDLGYDGVIVLHDGKLGDCIVWSSDNIQVQSID